MNRPQIVATLGPATGTARVAAAILRAGVDVVRINASHGTAGEHTRRIRLFRSVAKRMRKKVVVLIDLPGPKFRLGQLPRGAMDLRAGQSVGLTGVGAKRRGRWLPLRQPELLSRLKPRQHLFLADGSVELEVLRASAGAAACRIITGGLVRSGSGLNLPHTDLGVTIPTPQDQGWIRFAARQRAQWLAVSFVQTRDDVRRVRQEALALGYRPKLMAKIEKRKALENLEAIIEEADGVMVARGDLGVETPFEEIPFAQKKIIASSNRRRKPVVTATQMLESMVAHPTPTRAEVTDIANAVVDGTDGAMLSAESAIGRYPVQAVEVLSRVLTAAARAIKDGEIPLRVQHRRKRM